jgi:hypothetical protein
LAHLKLLSSKMTANSAANTTPLRSLLLILLLGWATAAGAQQKAFNYGIVSPNTRENMKLEEAIKGMNSAEEVKLHRQAINLSCVVRSRVRAFRALGSWSDGAEHSILFRVQSDEATLRYLLSRMGRDAEQKYVIYFHPQPKGEADLYTLRLARRARSLVTLSNALEQAGIPFRTVVPSGETTTVYIIDLDRDLRDKIRTAARRLRARVSQQAGNAELFGADQRPQARVKFEQEITSYEAKNPNLPPACDVQKRKVKGH